MRYTTVLVAASSLLGASAVTPVARALEARDTASCISAASKYLPSVTSNAPTPTGAVLTYLAGVTAGDQCAFPTVTGTLGSSVSSYASSYSSWYSAHIGDIQTVYQACTDVPEVTSELKAIFGDATGSACDSIYAQITSKPTSSKNAAGPRETGMPFAAAALVAGIAAAVL